MRRLPYLFALVLSVMTIYSCSDDFNELDEIAEVAEINSSRSLDLAITSLAGIENPLVSEQLPISKRHMMDIMSKERGFLLDGYDLKDLSLNKDNVLIFSNADGITSYSFAGSIPGKETIDFRLTLNFTKEGILNNYVQLGADEPLYFDSEGKITGNNARYGGSKPSNIPSKAPKSVICNYNWNGSMPSQVASYCGIYGGTTVPAPIEILAALFPEWYVWTGTQWMKLSSPIANIPLTNDYNDLYYITSNGNLMPFFIFYLNGFPGFKNEVIQYYGQVYVSQLGYAITNPYSQVSEEIHVHKQAFFDSYMEWLYDMQSQAPANYNYLVANPSVMYEIFQFFAEYNSNNTEDSYTYLGQPWWVYQYAPNPDVKCMNTGAQFLLTSAGLSLMQDLGSGTIDINGFRNGLPDC